MLARQPCTIRRFRMTKRYFPTAICSFHLGVSAWKWFRAAEARALIRRFNQRSYGTSQRFRHLMQKPYFYPMDLFLQGWFLLSFAFTGLLCGASLDQSIKQLPARHKIGTRAFSAYAKAADLKTGVGYYAFLGLGSGATCLAAAFTVAQNEFRHSYDGTIYLAAFFATSHLICTAIAAPLYFSQKNVNEKEELRTILNKFEKIQTIRSVAIGLCFISTVWTAALALC
jgi:hypothetical protein